VQASSFSNINPPRFGTLSTKEPRCVQAAYTRFDSVRVACIDGVERTFSADVSVSTDATLRHFV
jgi:hypothetical protein